MNEIEIKRNTERVIMAEIYTENGAMGINFTEDSNKSEVLYFLESLIKVERLEFEEMFTRRT